MENKNLDNNVLYEVVKKLIGEINPIGETNVDNDRFENLKTTCDLINNLLTDVDDVAYRNENSLQFSRNRASEYASNFYKQLGIKD